MAALGGGALLVLGGGGGNEEIRAVIRENAQALEDGSVDRYIETMHPESPIYDRTRSQTEALLQEVQAGDLTVEVTIESVDTLGEERAEAETVQTTRADIQDFRDNRVDQVHELRTYQGEWRIYDSTVEDIEYL